MSLLWLLETIAKGYFCGMHTNREFTGVSSRAWILKKSRVSGAAARRPAI